jgi:hypothetical protein
MNTKGSTLDNLLIKFNCELTQFTALPFNIDNFISREAISQQARVIEACKAKGENYEMIFRFMGGPNLRYEWSANLNVGVETLAVYRDGYIVPVVVIDRQFPWAGTPAHERMAAFVAHHQGKDPANAVRQAAERTVEILNEIIVKWMQHDLNNVKAVNVHEAFKDFKAEHYQ